MPVDDAVFRRLVAEEDVLGDREQRHQRQLLVDDDDAEMLAVGDAGEAPLGALIDDLAFVGAVRIDAGKDFHQRRLAGAVLAADGVNLALLDGEIDVAKRFHAGETLGNPSHFEDCAHPANSLKPAFAMIGAKFQATPA